jgi:uncharacterized protein (DUF2062 family)
MPRLYLRQLTQRLQPAIDNVTAHPFVARWLPALRDPDLWHINRRSAARAVAIGLFCGLIPGPFQVLGSILMCLWIRANFPIAIVTTFYTNPLTIVPLYVVAYEMGKLFFPDAPAMPRIDVPEAMSPGDFVPALWDWMKQLGKPLAIGLPMLAASLAFLGWAFVRLGWRLHAMWAWRRRARTRGNDGR